MMVKIIIEMGPRTVSVTTIKPLKPQSHIACNRSATSLWPKFRVVARRLQGGCKEVDDCSPTGCRRLQVFDGHRQVADRSPSGWRLIADQLQRLQTIPTQFVVTDWSPTSRLSVADRSPKSCRLSAIINKRSRCSRQPVADRSPIGCQSLPNWSLMGRQPLSDYKTI